MTADSDSGRWWMRGGLALVFTLLALFAIRGLHVQTGLVDLLPQHTPAAQAYRDYLAKFGGGERLYVLVDLPGAQRQEAELLIEAADEIALRLGELDSIQEARSGLSEEDERFLLDWVLPNAWLLRDDEAGDLIARLTEPALDARVANLRQALAQPVPGVWQEAWLADPLGLAAPELLKQSASLPVDPLSGGFFSESANASLVIATPAVATLDPKAGRALLTEIENACQGVASELGRNLRCAPLGGPLYAAWDEAIIRKDLTATITGSMLAIGLMLVLFFRGVRAPLALQLAVAIGVLWTGGLAAALYGNVNVLALAFASILIGLGVDYGIHLATRFQMHRGGGAVRSASMVAALRETRGALIASALTTVGGFAVMLFATFEPLRQLGVLVSLGIGAMLLSAGLAVAPLLVWLSPSKLPRGLSAMQRALTRAAVVLSRWAAAHRGIVLGVTILLLAVAAAGLTRLEFSADLRSLRPTDHPAQETENRLVSAFGMGLESSAVLVSGADLDEALARAARVAAELRVKQFDVFSPADWLVDRATLEQRAAQLPTGALRSAVAGMERRLESDGFRLAPFAPALGRLRALSDGEIPQRPERLPSWMDALLAVDEGETTVLLQVEASVERYEELAAIEGASVAVASVPRLGVEVRERLRVDLGRLALIAFAVSFLILLVSFGGALSAALAALVPVIFGIVLLLGGCGWLGVPIDPFAIALAPMILGIGIDDGIHVLHGRRRLGSAVDALAEVGPAIGLTSLTTFLGFIGLLASSLPALRRGGLLIALGIALCYLATTLILPALLRSRGAPSGPTDSERDEAALNPTEPSAARAKERANAQAPQFSQTARRSQFHVSGVFWYKLLDWAVRVPNWIKVVVVWISTWIATFMLGGVRNALASNLEPLLGKAGPMTAFWRGHKSLFQFAWCLTERYERLSERTPFDAEFDGLEHWTAMDRAEHGFILMTAHFGNWETGSMVPSTDVRRRVHVVREREADPEAQEFTRQILERQGGGLYVTHFVEDDPRLGLRLLEALRGGEVVALQGDRVRAGGKTIVCEMFGSPYGLPEGLFALARSAGVPILPVFTIREGRRKYRIKFFEPAWVDATKPRKQGIQEAAEQVIGAIGAVITERPHQWFCFNRAYLPPQDDA